MRVPIFQQRELVAAAVAVALIGCGGGPKVEQIISKEPYAALPSGAKMLVGFQPKLIASNPWVARLRAALGQQGGDLPLMGIARQVGVDPARQIDAGAWALYSIGPQGPIWGLVLTGDLDEAATLQAVKTGAAGAPPAEIQPKSYAKVSYYDLIRRGPAEPDETFVVFPISGVLLASNNQAVVQNGIVVWRGKADSIRADSNFAPLFNGLSTSSPAWVAGWARGTLDQMTISAGFLSRGDNLGQGVDWYRAALDVGQNMASLTGVLECQNADSANRQSKNYQELITSYARVFFQEGLGPGAITLAKTIHLSVEGLTISLSAEMSAEELEQVAQQFEQARQSPQTIQDLLRRRAPNRPAAPPGQPGIEPEAEPGAEPGMEPGMEPQAEPGAAPGMAPGGAPGLRPGEAAQTPAGQQPPAPGKSALPPPLAPPPGN